MIRALAAAMVAVVMGVGVAQAQWYLAPAQRAPAAASQAPAAGAGACTFRTMTQKMGAATEAFARLQQSNPQRAQQVEAQMAPRMAALMEINTGSGPVADDAPADPRGCAFWDEFLAAARG